jgi:hypothetical protein
MMASVQKRGSPQRYVPSSAPFRTDFRINYVYFFGINNWHSSDINTGVSSLPEKSHSHSTVNVWFTLSINLTLMELILHILLLLLLLLLSLAQRGLWPPRHTRFRDHTQRRATVGRTPLGRVIISSQSPLPNTQHTQQTNIHASRGIRTHDRSRRAGIDLHLRPRGHWDRHSTDIFPLYFQFLKMYSTFNYFINKLIETTACGYCIIVFYFYRLSIFKVVIFMRCLIYNNIHVAIQL